MSRIRGFGRFWWDFVVGDDWRAAAGVVLAIGATAALAAAGIVVAIGITAAIGSWWFLPPAVALVLALSLRREATKSSAQGH